MNRFLGKTPRSPKTKQRNQRSGEGEEERRFPPLHLYIVPIMIGQLQTTCHSLSVTSCAIDRDAVCLIDISLDRCGPDQ